MSAYDWLNTSLAGLNVTVWVNNSDVGGGEEAGAHPPSVQRWTQPVNLAGVFPLGCIAACLLCTWLGGVPCACCLSIP